MNGIFKKQFALQACALIVVFALLSSGVTKLFSSFFISQKEEYLISQAEKIIQVYKQSIFFYGKFEREIKEIEEYLDCSFIVADSQNCILVTSSDIGDEWLGVSFTFSERNINEESDEIKIFKIQGNLGGIFSEEVLTIGYPIVIGGVDIGTVFVSTSITSIVNTISTVYQIIIMIMITAILLVFLLVYIFSKKISVPLIEINKVAKIIADGNFEKKIYIDSNDEIGELATILNEMAKNLSEQEKRRREFISNISHDIRSPLTSMKGFLEALIDGTIPEDKRERYLNIILEETERLTRLSNNILDINRLEDFNRENKNVKFNINELIRNIIMSFEARLITKEIKINASFERDELIVVADIEKIERVVYNLLDNAIKFTENNKNIFVTTKIKGEKVLVSIRDEGKGIPLDMQKKVFERFYKVDTSRGQDKRGSGLGLSIVKEFILAQGESVTINSELNKGSEFIFTLTLDE